MTDLRERFQKFDEVPVPELWERITELADEEDSSAVPSVTRRRWVVAVAAAVAVLLIVGLPILLVSGDEPPPAVASWTSVPVEVPSDEAIADIAAIPSGGFVALTVDPAQVVWTPDAVNWFHADTEGLVGSTGRSVTAARFEASSVASGNNLIAIIDRDRAGVWIGDQRAETWRFTPLADSAEADRTRLLTIAASEDQVLIVGQLLSTEVAEGTESELLITDRFVSWVIDGPAGEISQQDLPVPAPSPIDFVDADATSFAGRWLVVVTGAEWQGVEGWNPSELILTLTTSGWVSSERNPEMGDITSISGGPSSAVITSCHFGGDSFWYTTDGLTWTQATNDFTGHLARYVDDLGFVVHYGTGWYLSEDGSSWQFPADAGVTIESYPRSGYASAASEGRVFEFDNQLWMWSRA